MIWHAKIITDYHRLVPGRSLQHLILPTIHWRREYAWEDSAPALQKKTCPEVARKSCLPLSIEGFTSGVSQVAPSAIFCFRKNSGKQIPKGWSLSCMKSHSTAHLQEKNVEEGKSSESWHHHAETWAMLLHEHCMKIAWSCSLPSSLIPLSSLSTVDPDWFSSFMTFSHAYVDPCACLSRCIHGADSYHMELGLGRSHLIRCSCGRCSSLWL